MEFWGLEVKPGQSVKVSPDDDEYLHLSQGALGEVKKDDKATMFVKVDDQKLSIGTLSTDKLPQIQFDLVFEREFELSHTSKSSSVFFSGYKVFSAEAEDFDPEEESEDEEEEELLEFRPVNVVNAYEGKADAKDKEPKQVKIESAAAKTIFGKSKKDEDSDDDDDDEGNDDSESSESDDSSDNSDDEEEEEVTSKKPETGKKRAAGSVLKTPASDKRAKVATPSGQKTGDKKRAVHVATPHPAKKAGKTPATSEKSPKSGGSVACKSCPKTFNSENALQVHSNAKHKAAAK